MISDVARKLKNELILRRKESKASLKDIDVVLVCHRYGEFEKAKRTNLYKSHSAEYCTLLEILNWN
ncbi:hypothetical protein UFOVP103_41 [uncultured Caudovirales phage]|uniref:Uncharacterized protein n=1 Tax=uncultured Caudovirales phage TaxID=2100421 RepID=A0A6J7WMW2_9CAUD|nr:hypothetical protein UFOVP103_41 [uncultured Caudovirales phage]CAB5216894.1 hypothetical protein UFOVP197_14 [uncultured Caudovirales phage]